ncbi:MAG: MBL fold metallo-hydrolase [Deltaproteobacteria bacterium]|nr:MBL fold metallo-hydrolase [Deltaproteobacteria bacterium]
MIIEQIPVGAMDVFCYLLGCERQRKAMYIDPAGDTDLLLERLKVHNLTLEYIVNTHGHPDHTCGNADLRKATGAKIAIHERDASMASNVDVKLRDGDRIQIGSLNVGVLHTPGHTRGGICLYVGGHLFTGDTLFVGAVGRTDLRGGDFGSLLMSIKDKLLPLPPETVVWPGHDYGDRPSSTLAHECDTNPYISDFILQA